MSWREEGEALQSLSVHSTGGKKRDATQSFCHAASLSAGCQSQPLCHFQGRASSQ